MKELLLIPGPTPVSEEVLSALRKDTMAHTDDRFAKIMSDALQKTKILFGAESGFPFIIAGSGTLGMEMALTNILNEGENLLVISHGFFGDRFVDLGHALNINTDVLKTDAGSCVPLETIKNTLQSKHFHAVTITHVDTSTGTLADVENIARLIHEVSPDTLIVVDGVCATGGVPEAFDDWGLDVIFTGSQKALAVPPGLTLLAFSQRAIEKRKSMTKTRTYYGDILRWMPVMADPHKYFATPAVNMVYALDASLNIILNYGLEAYYKKHQDLAKKVRGAMETLNFELVSKNPAPTLSVFLFPQGVDDATFRSKLAVKGVIVAGALAELQGKAFRMGHMGSVTEDELFIAIKKILEVCEEMGIRVDKGKALDTFLES
ncbi:pyridoxal-phosphate-dependent aminotransferase family protein [Coprothermobacter platensis]|uniref:pyridoxal-phosphate-dependent aminotransferase family protein n=1 Tax=Coprothermobacter platensis TaxID=108819 RepID=UPI00036B2714|nr:alanine--glyoxylate aminotransferase family protein [Coprothermobacter platensis]